MTYLYKTLAIGKHRATATLNEYGKQGWRVITFVTDAHGIAHILLERVEG